MNVKDMTLVDKIEATWDCEAMQVFAAGWCMLMALVTTMDKRSFRFSTSWLYVHAFNNCRFKAARLAYTHVATVPSTLSIPVGCSSNDGNCYWLLIQTTCPI